MRLASFRHKDLERLWCRNDPRGIARQHQAKLRAMLTVLEEVENLTELATMRGWRLHSLKGKRAGVWRLTVTHNYRLTFKVHSSVVSDIDIEDYH